MGRELLRIVIADIPVTLDLGPLPTHRREYISAVYTHFIDPTPSDSLCVELLMEAGPPFIDPNNHSAWQLETRQQGARISFRSFFEQGWIDRAAGQAQLTLREYGNPENFLRVIYAWECLLRGGLLLHASGVIRDGLGYVFFGPSGAGKTTATQLSPGTVLLSDDLVILTKRNDRFWVHGTPFRGEAAEGERTNAAAPLHGLFALCKAPTHALVDMPPAQAVAELAASVPFVTGRPDGAALVMARCAEIEADTPVRRLQFARNEGFWAIVR